MDELVQIRSLIGKILDDSLSEDESEQLGKLLASSELAQQEYCDFIATHAALSEEFGVPEQTEGVARPPAASHSNVRWQTVLEFFTKPTPLSMTVAALAMVAIIGLMAFIAVPYYGARRQSEASAYVAQMSKTHAAIWSPDHPAHWQGKSLKVGSKLQLEAGLAQIEYTNGATVLLEGPVVYEITSAGGRLQRGKLAAKVDKPAYGFAVTTPSAVIVDLGTEFGVSVAESGDTQTSVFRGIVSVSMADNPARSVQLTAHQSARVTATTLELEKDKPLPKYARALPQHTNGQVSEIGLVNGDFLSPVLHSGSPKFSNAGDGWFAKNAGEDWVIASGKLIQRKNSGSKTRIAQVFDLAGHEGNEWTISMDVGGRGLARVEVYGCNRAGASRFKGEAVSVFRDSRPANGGQWTTLVERADVSPGRMEIAIPGHLTDFDTMSVRITGNAGTVGTTVDNVLFRQKLLR